MSSLHGTVMSLMQDTTPENPGLPRDPLPEELAISQKLVLDLPAEYAVVPPCFLNVNLAKCTLTEKCTATLCEEHSPLEGEKPWLQRFLEEDSYVPWAEYHSQRNVPEKMNTVTNIGVLPMFFESANNLAMMKHSMDVVMKSTKFLNPSQIPVTTVDQPLYALCKQLQFLLPDTLGEDHFFVMMGGLHIEMAALRMLGRWLDGSGWTEALVQAGVITPGRADAMLKAAHVKRARHAHEVTAATLYSLQREAYSIFIEAAGDPMTFDQWQAECCKSVPQFKVWDIVLTLPLTLLQFVRAERTAHFHLYIGTLSLLIPWFFGLDMTNYARWAPVHLRDLVNLRDKHPDLYSEFESGNFVARKTTRSFFTIALDQAHEQVNALLKGDGGMVGLTENPDALKKMDASQS